MALRCFIAIETPESVKEIIGNIMDILTKTDADVKWVPYENIHITLKFLGNTDEALITPIKNALCKKLLPYKPFYIKITDIGYFPGSRRPRVIWLGIEESEVLGKLHSDINNEMVFFGYEEEKRKFSPHFTIGRVRSQKRIQEMIKTMNEFSTPSFEDIEIRNITLMKSELNPAGAKYHRLAEIPFGGKA
jgi:2'-5' RNA ligase